MHILSFLSWGKTWEAKEGKRCEYISVVNWNETLTNITHYQETNSSDEVKLLKQVIQAQSEIIMNYKRGKSSLPGWIDAIFEKVKKNITSIILVI